MRQYYHRYTVEGSGYFPLDMLRYDSSYPATSEAVDGLNGLQEQQRTVELGCVNHKKWEPTVGRWNSFGWSVTSHRVMGVVQ